MNLLRLRPSSNGFGLGTVISLRNINLLGGGCNVKTYSYLYSYWPNVNERKGWYLNVIAAEHQYVWIASH